MAGESEDGAFDAVIRLLINLSALAVSAGIVALIIATIAVEID